ncbi:hypothetical protein ACJ72_03248 [Emergomyces africanus]|uniref:Uncharacterized protein n=1 Tax=Emergomyces africanus TaxID=1955775 RepID=A0A1B7P034_9EURO|nr:hypothetical protein ACJ72_03248 [Emergomyces africanus]
MLNDDDEEIRYLAAQAGSILFSLEFDNTNQTTALLPLAASSKLVDILADDFTDSSTLCAEAMGRFLGLPINLLGAKAKDTISLTPVSRLLAEFQTESTVLFQEERQNLFVEDVREVETWAKVLSRLVVVPRNSNFALQFYSWVADGLCTLAEETAEASRDGVLGWISHPDVFTLGIRVILGAKILLLASLSETLVLDKFLIRQRLENLWKEGQKNEMHHCWLSLLRTVVDYKQLS